MSKHEIITSRADDREKQINAKALQRYVDAKGYKLIPLKGKISHSSGLDKAELKRRKGDQALPDEGLQRRYRSQRNPVGGRHRPAQWRRRRWTNLCFEFGIDELIFPAVTTGGGGKHY